MTDHTDEERKQDDRMARMSHAIVAAVGAQDGSTDAFVVMGALGAAAGALAVASGRPDECLGSMVEIARMIVSGALLDPE